ncbi:unnamed protein product [Paramecium octaurelia]|uniref:Uncharacterized protein n=1 Tax=Paramecium octaurelia TaxID=43137 RepID=A0A8S1YPV9_PAROT|nr:unnamed protein product [Paramecium octaurelia]
MNGHLIWLFIILSQHPINGQTYHDYQMLMQYHQERNKLNKPNFHDYYLYKFNKIKKLFILKFTDIPIHIQLWPIQFSIIPNKPLCKQLNQVMNQNIIGSSWQPQTTLKKGWFLNGQRVDKLFENFNLQQWAIFTQH